MRKIIFILISLLLIISAPSEAAERNPLWQSVSEIITGKKATIGVSIFIDGNEILSVNNHYKYPMLSVFKFHQALAVCHYLQKNNIPLDHKLYIRKKDLHENTHSPLRDKYPDGGVHITIRELLEYTLQLSDNNACDILFCHICSPSKTDNYIRSLGLNEFSISATEKDMHNQIEACYNNWSSPSDAAKLIDKFLRENLLAPEYQSFIKNTMIACNTGKNRLPKPFHGKNIIIGHKTGTGDKNRKGQITGVNDMGFVILPNGKTYAIAVFIKDSEEPLESAEKIMAEISQVAYSALSSTKPAGTH